MNSTALPRVKVYRGVPVSCGAWVMGSPNGVSMRIERPLHVSIFAVSLVTVSPATQAQKFITIAMEREYCPCSRDYNILADVYVHRRAGHSTTGVLFSQVLPACMYGV